MAKLNEIGIRILKAKRQKFKAGSDFSVAFIGDSHIGETTVHSPKEGPCECGSNCPERRYKTLLSKINALKSIYAIIHGGDGADYAAKMLKRFVNDTEAILKYNNTTISDADKKPLLHNIGNHEYKIGKNPSTGVDMNEYNNLVGKANNIIKFFGSTNGPKVAVILLNTGYSNHGQLPKGMNFKTQLDNLAKQMDTIIQNHNSVRFIIDMHIPPRIPHQLTGSHVLNDNYNYYFRQFLKKHPGRILAIVTHHKHGTIQMAAYQYTFKTKNKKYNIPVYLTAQGGNCDYNKSPNEPTRYGFYRMVLTKSGNSYKIKNVYRYDMVRSSSGSYVLAKPVLIKK